jgi:murein DD-endopeptidase MepM/ murein hydrolase activator NlpD
MRRSKIVLPMVGFFLSSCGQKMAPRFYLQTASDVRVESIGVATETDSLAEKNYRPAYVNQAFGDRLNSLAEKHPWPVRILSIGHSTASYQNYGGEAYFHHGLDIRADAGSDVRASAGGVVVNIENYMPGNPAYWEVAILDDQGFIWQYHHVDRNSIPQEIWTAFRNKTRIEAGTKIGEVYYWTVTTYGEVYHHVHLNILARGGAYRNPFDFLQPLPDTAAPKFLDVGLMKNGYAQNPTLPISGRYGVYATVHDLILHDKFVVPPHKITYQLDDDPRERLVWEFSTLPGETSNTQFVDEFFVPSMTCGNYDCRKLTVNIGFATEGQRWLSNVPGEHRIVIHASDVAGNRTSQEFKWQVRSNPEP